MNSWGNILNSANHGEIKLIDKEDFDIFISYQHNKSFIESFFFVPYGPFNA